MISPEISVCKKKGGFSIACFEKGYECIRDFQFYSDETEGIQEAVEFFKAKGVLNPEVIRPQITSMRLTYAKRKKR